MVVALTLTFGFDFSKVHCLWPKNWPFQTFCFREYRPGKCVLRHSSWKKTSF